MVGTHLMKEAVGMRLLSSSSFATLRMTRRAVESAGILKAIAVRKASLAAAFRTIVILSVAKDLFTDSGKYARCL